MPLLEPDPGALRPDVRPEDASSDRVTDAGAGGTPEPLRSDLLALLGPEKVLTHISDLVRYASDASPYRFLPRVVVLPGTTAEVAAVLAYAREHGLQTRITRIFNTYGPRMRTDDGRALPNFFTQALRGEPVTLYGDGSQTRSFCYISDLVAGIVALLEGDYSEPVNLGNPEEVTMAEVVAEVLELAASSSSIVRQPLPPDDPQRRQPDIAVAIRELGWQPRVPRPEGLRHTLAYFQAELAKV